jgi:glutamine kinase
MNTTAKPFAFGTKGETLQRLAPLVRSGRLCEQLLIPVPRWLSEPDAVLDSIIDRFASARLAVRSSGADEDGWNGSMAGRYTSQMNIAPECEALSRAIDTVIDSYGRRGGGDQVLVQPLVENVAISGVATTRDLHSGGPYYVVNYDDVSGRTDTVTGGAVSKTVFFHRPRLDAIHSSRFRKLIETLREIEMLTGRDELDIEFCIDAADEIYILQVRPIAASARWNAPADDTIDAALGGLRRQLAPLMAPAAGIAGNTTILGEMPDWNPAEMIGNMPRPLAMSLYKRLITDETWWRARAEMGYRPTPHPLMVDLCGRPYIDVRLSLNSFLPDGIDDDAAARIVDAEVAILADNPDLHDKIEFEVAPTCRDFAFDDCAQRLSASGLGGADIEALETGLRAVTGAALGIGKDGIAALLARTATRAPAPAESDGLDAARHYFAHCIPYGTLPFSALARHAFIGVAFLKSLTAIGIFSGQEVDAFFRGIRTVAAWLVEDMRAIAENRLGLDAFLERHGHLRPGTYDILSRRYDERPEMFTGTSHPPSSPAETPPFAPDRRQRDEIDRLLAGLGYGLDTDGLLAYVAAAVGAREESKFAFSRDISDGLKAITEWGEAHGFSQDDLSFASIDDILAASGDPALLREKIARGREANAIAHSLRLPHLILEPDDLDVVRLPEGRPNFVTNHSVTCPARHLADASPDDISGAIVLIESADPGFDWIFSRDIAGLITKYGGANSHMAIRCAEFGLPAAVGCGESLFQRLEDAAVIELNCAAQIVRPATEWQR